MKRITQFNEVFQHERRLFRAEHMTLIVAFILLVATAYALVNGQQWVSKQHQAVQAAQAEEHVRVQELKDNLVAMNAGTFKPSSDFNNPGNALSVGNRHAATYAILPATALAVTAVGQSDLNPSYVKVTAETKDTFALNEEIDNPSNLLIGNFDLAFVIIFLLPLLIIALSYNLLSGEREQGTLAVTLTNPLPLWTLIAGKVAFRAGLVFTVTTSIVLAGLFIMDSGLTSLDGIVRLAWWIVVLLAYIFFWFSLTVAVNAFAKTSAQNALMLTGLWILIVLVLPTFISIAVNVVSPVPPRVEMVGMIRSAQTAASNEYDATLARFEQEHPEMTADPDVEKSVALAAARKRVLVQQAAAERIEVIMARYDDQLTKQQNMIAWLRFLSPAIVMQEALNHVAGTDSRRYQHLSHQVDQFHANWQNFFLPRVLENTPLKLADYEQFPRFKYVKQSLLEISPPLFGWLLGLLIPMGLLCWLSMHRIRTYVVNG